MQVLMTRLGLSALASVLALAFFTMPALADHECIIPEVPEVIADPNVVPPIVGVPAIPARACTTEEEAAANTHRSNTNKGNIETNTTAIGDWKNKNGDNTITKVIGTWTDPNRETPVKEAIEKNERDIAKNRTDFEAADRALSRRIDKNSEAIEDAIALSAAIPDSWLSDSENFAISLGGGFTDGSSAFGGIGTFRINKNLSAYGGGSTLTDGGTWAAKGGVRLGW